MEAARAPSSATTDEVAARILEAREGERSRLAQEIHDGPAQALANAIFAAEYLERIVGSDPDAAAAEVRGLIVLLRRELDGVRDFIQQLRPALLDEQGLDGAILDAAGRLQRLSAITVATDLGAPVDWMSDDERVVALRIAQEALHNVRKHAAAGTVVISTGVVDDDWVLEIRDDGRGFDPDTTAAHGRRTFGLRFMRERADTIGARFDVRSRPDGGTVVRLAIPRGARAGAKENG
jgi:two-component system sensor histidine kinase DegS